VTPSWRLLVAASAERTLARLPTRVARAVVEFMRTVLLEEPHRAGRPLSRELSGFHSARKGAYRIAYRIDEDNRTVRVVRIEHRSDVYRQR
jgi:mRNA-degrading endonuclease RelE of RelBE toxin-antitoxin system